jgi:hypothetical protein
MANCTNLVSHEEYNPRTGNLVEFAGKCGDYLYLKKRLCSPCLTAATKSYPQGWDTYPGDICKHGTYVGGVEADYICGSCEYIGEQE